MTPMISRRQMLAALAAGATIFAAAPAISSTDSAAADYVTGVGKNVLELANGSVRGKALRGKFASLMGRYVNLPDIGLSALGTYRKQLPAGDKGKFNELLTTYAAALFVWYADEFKGSDFVVDDVVPKGKGLLVKTHIVQGAVSGEQIEWYVVKSGSGVQILDLKVKGVWLSISMRDAFSRELKKSKGDFQSLYAFLQEAETW